MNDLAVRVAKLEGKKKEVSIAQIKEVIKNLAVVLDTDPNADQIFEEYRHFKRRHY
jgi:hypothetical protein